MKLRYQMRGLGIGIIVTALLMGVATKDGIPLSDAEIKALATELGMVESGSLKLTDIQNATAKPADDAKTPAGESEGSGAEISGTEGTDTGTSNPEGGGTDTTEPEGGGTDTTEPEGGGTDTSNPEGGGTDTAEPEGGGEAGSGTQTGDNTQAPEEDETPEPSEQSPATEESRVVRIVVEPGDTSYDVSIKLAAAGLVEDAAEYDTYLCDNEYSRSIDIGTFEIVMGSSEEEIAKIITKTR